jgi:hypothetical protein
MMDGIGKRYLVREVGLRFGHNHELLIIQLSLTR